MWSVSVRGRCMFAHSFKGELFGPAQNLHGITLVVDAIFKGPKLDADASYLLDICLAEDILGDVLGKYHNQNLDDLPEFQGVNTTCETMAEAIWRGVVQALPPTQRKAVAVLTIRARESDVAYVEYEAPLTSAFNNDGNGNNSNLKPVGVMAASSPSPHNAHAAPLTPSPPSPADLNMATAAVTKAQSQSVGERREERSFLSFVAPRDVRVEADTRPPCDRAPGPGEVELSTVCSLVSTGTELTVYRGEFEDAANAEALDATIGGMGNAMAYPLQYGYSLVGDVVAVGEGVPADMLGRRVFAFAPHSSVAVVSADGIMPLPPGTEAADATFLPAVETAVSIVHDAHPRLGETVCVVGEGLIGLLVTAVLSQTFGDAVTVIAVDPVRARRERALALGASRAVSPEDLKQEKGVADVSIDVSGVSAGLQTAIDATRDYGRVVVASWYGRKPLSLTLGTRFHRSHIELVASQVSEIAPAAAGLWSKARRFELAFELVRGLTPSQLVTLAVPLEHAPEAYAQLDTGATTVALLYCDGGECLRGNQSAPAQSLSKL